MTKDPLHEANRLSPSKRPLREQPFTAAPPDFSLKPKYRPSFNPYQPGSKAARAFEAMVEAGFNPYNAMDQEEFLCLSPENREEYGSVLSDIATDASQWQRMALREEQRAYQRRSQRPRAELPLHPDKVPPGFDTQSRKPPAHNPYLPGSRTGEAFAKMQSLGFNPYNEFHRARFLQITKPEDRDRYRKAISHISHDTSIWERYRQADAQSNMPPRGETM